MRGFALGTAVLIFLLDQAVKWWMLGPFDLAAKGRHAVLPFFDLVLVWNRGISYGLFQQESALGRYLLIALMVGVGLFLVYQIARGGQGVVLFAYGLIAGGAFGNALDRMIHGAVVDYALLHWRSFSWYVFNLADVAIVAGVLVLVYDFLRDRKSTGAR